MDSETRKMHQLADNFELHRRIIQRWVKTNRKKIPKEVRTSIEVMSDLCKRVQAAMKGVAQRREVGLKAQPGITEKKA